MEPGISDVPLLLSLAQGRVSCLALLALWREVGHSWSSKDYSGPQG